MSKGPVELGEVAVTDAYELDADVVVHAAAMPHYGDGKATENSIREATKNALDAADERGCESLVIPALGCGVAGFDFVEGARAIADEIAAYEPTNLRDVRFIVYSDDEYDKLKRALEDVT